MRNFPSPKKTAMCMKIISVLLEVSKKEKNHYSSERKTRITIHES